MDYIVEGGTAHFGGDIPLKLTKEQAAPRSHRLEDLGKGVYRPTNPVEFKAGEKVCIDLKPEHLPRHLAAVLRPVEKAKANNQVKAPTPLGTGENAGTGDSARQAPQG